uniref:PEST proteolytic signal-containing nuclear protein n=1 Tax=Panagrolaimus sp. PS1159 TaxID=55785 RepID=A0AC35ESH1_9BILA
MSEETNNEKNTVEKAIEEEEEEMIIKRRHCAPKINTKDRLFGATPEQPRKVAKTTATFKSNIFGPEPQSPAKTSKKQIPVIERNPITGEVKIPPRVTV